MVKISNQLLSDARQLASYIAAHLELLTASTQG